MNQTRLGSLIEACISTVIGYLTTLALAPFVYPIFGHAFTAAQNVAIAAIFTVLSVVRGYIIRRWFNARLQRAARAMAARLTA